MKKIFLLLAFSGIVGAGSANALVASGKTTTVTFKQDEKKKKDKNHDCSKHEQKKCHSDSTKSCAKQKKGKKDCCKHGATPAVPPAK